ncbi:MAG: hypothetical protein JWN34_604 [Bryobacterales bacterium]|nr:hypothetical protein [Bryobacterales bacterium]
MRGPRSFFRKLVSHAVLQCTSCKRQISIRRRWLGIFQRYAECPICSSPTPSRIFSRDRVDAMSRNPLRKLLAIFGCPLYHCIYCRYQFRDWRKRLSDERVSPTYKMR